MEIVMARRTTVTALCAAALVLALPAAASAAGEVTPTSGPLAGGTVVSIVAPAGLASVTGHGLYSLWFLPDGTLYSWGADASEQLGDGPGQIDRFAPVRVAAPPGVTFVSIGAGGTHVVALGSDGATYAWGNDGSGQQGNGPEVNGQATPGLVTMPPGVTFTSVAAGGAASYAIGSDGNTYAWGANSLGQLGDASTDPTQSSPVLVATPPGVTFRQVSGGAAHALALDTSGNAYAWGSNFYGQLGLGVSGAVERTPLPVVMPVGVTFTSVSAGDYHSLALGSDGNVYAWGLDMFGGLGDDAAFVDQPAPVRVAAPPGVSFVAVSAGSMHSLALASDGTVYAWGRDDGGQLGDDAAFANQPTPRPVAMPTGVSVVSLSAGLDHSLAVGSDGATYSWGWASFGRLGRDTGGVNQPEPGRLAAPQVTAVSFGGVDGTDLTFDAGSGRWTVTTPPGASAGAFDVIVRWNFNGDPQPPVTYASAFRYVAPVPPPNPQNPPPVPNTPSALAATGFETVGWAAVAALSLALGVGALMLRRRDQK
jgi:alpha-tubulin suppressor-like RCC1 family protein